MDKEYFVYRVIDVDSPIWHLSVHTGNELSRRDKINITSRRTR